MLKMDQKGLKIDYKGLKVVFFGLWIIDSAVFLAELGGNPLPPFADNIFGKNKLWRIYLRTKYAKQPPYVFTIKTNEVHDDKH